MKKLIFLMLTLLALAEVTNGEHNNSEASMLYDSYFIGKKKITKIKCKACDLTVAADVFGDWDDKKINL